MQDALRKHAVAAKQLQIAEAGTPVSNIGSHIDVMTEDMTYFNDLIGRFPWQTDVGVHQGVGLPSHRRVRYEPYGVVGAITPWKHHPRRRQPGRRPAGKHRDVHVQ